MTWLAFSGDYLYWTDWIERKVGRVNKHNGTRRTVVLEQLPDLMGIKAVNISAVEGLLSDDNNDNEEHIYIVQDRMSTDVLVQTEKQVSKPLIV